MWWCWRGGAIVMTSRELEEMLDEIFRKVFGKDW